MSERCVNQSGEERQRGHWGARIVLIVGFLGCAVCLFYGWNRTLLDLHGFRQAQTAISAYYFIHEGFTLDYQTPVLGKPWAIPFEFPLYQALVALLVKATGWPLDQTGRGVSLFFWVATAAPLYGLLRLWKVERWWCGAILLLVWSTPTYLFWSRTFMIESTALFFSLAYLYATIRAVRQRSMLWFILALMCGVLAGLQKATTFLIVLVPLLGFSAGEIWRCYQSRAAWKGKALAVVTLMLLPLGATVLWTRHTDALKARNPLGKDILISSSSYQRYWIYGNLSQRLHPKTWVHLLHREYGYGVGRRSIVLSLAVMVTLLWAMYRAPQWRATLSVLGAAYVAGPLAFTNLFHMHDYYSYENQLYLVLAFALALYACRESLPARWRRILPCAVILLWTGAGFAAYRYDYVYSIRCAPEPTALLRELEPLTQAGRPQDVLLIYGQYWDSTVPYYSRRKAVMHYGAGLLKPEAFRAALDALTPNEKIAAMVVSGDLAADSAFVAERIQTFDLHSTPIRTRWGDFYLKK